VLQDGLFCVFDLLSGLQLGLKVFTVTDHLSTSLQNPALTASDAMQMASNVVRTLVGLRTDDEWESFKAKLHTTQVSLGT
jgi:hypothetical protein